MIRNHIILIAVFACLICTQSAWADNECKTVDSLRRSARQHFRDIRGPMQNNLSANTTLPFGDGKCRIQFPDDDDPTYSCTFYLEGGQDTAEQAYRDFVSALRLCIPQGSDIVESKRKLGAQATLQDENNSIVVTYGIFSRVWFVDFDYQIGR